MIRKTRRQLEEDLRQAEQDLVEARNHVEASKIAIWIVREEHQKLRKRYDDLVGWYLVLKKHMEKDVLPEVLQPGESSPLDTVALD
jgi:hypothetical protein